MKTHRYQGTAFKIFQTPPQQVRQLTSRRRLTLSTVHFWLPLGVGLALLSAVLFPLNLLSSQPFHHDEALYATWALEIASGDNPWLEQIPIDKPPLFLYAAAGTMWLLGATETNARIPSLLATVLIVGLTFAMGRKLYDNGVGLLAAWLVALSPFTILFAPTAFTDPMLVALVLASCLNAAYGRAAWTGVWLGLAIATKQQGVFFVPLVVALLISAGRWHIAGGSRAEAENHLPHNMPSGTRQGHITRNPPDASVPRRGFTARSLPVPHFTLHALSRFLLALFLTLFPVILWDAARDQSPGFWQLSLDNYGGLTISIDNLGGFGERWAGYVELLQFGTASTMLNIVFLLGLPVLLIYGLGQTHRENVTRDQAGKTANAVVNESTNLPAAVTIRFSKLHQYLYDWIFALFILAYLVGHTWLSFQVWDRYLLGLIPLAALLLARVLLLPWSILKDFWLNDRPNMLWIGRLVAPLAVGLLLTLTLARPLQDAVNARYPMGSNSRALQGIEQIVAYLHGRIGANNTLYQRWLGAHWRFYLWDYPYDLQYWESPQFLASKAQAGHLIAFPTWHSETEARLALAEAGLGLQELTRAYTPAGNPSIILYQIKAK